MSHHDLVVAEQKEGVLRPVTAEIIGQLATQGSVEAVIVGDGASIEAVAPQLAALPVERVHTIDNAAFSHYQMEGYMAALNGLVQANQPEAVWMGATARGRDLAPRLATRLGGAYIPDIIGFEEGHYLRSVYGGKAQILVNRNGTGGAPVLTLRPNIFPAAEASGGDAPIEPFAFEMPDLRAQVKEVLLSAEGGVDLTEARVIVSGGRGIKGPENYKIIEELASLLGGSAGASRAVVDAGWVPHANQVGQTGKVVSPDLYIALGISGAIQHLAGMNSSKCIVAVNKDPEAPIFKIADYGIVGDLFEVAPILQEELAKVVN